MATTIRPVTELDFDQLKSDIIAFAKTNPTFTDYNFEGSALNSIIDILAFNTHTNAYYANMLHNEGFLDTAQKRSSVVSRAKELGYTPRSSVCSTAYLDITVFGVPLEVTSMSIPRGTAFTSTNDNGTFSFVSVETNNSKRNSDGHFFKSVKIVNGVRVKNTFTVDTSANIRQIFTIPNANVDTSTIKVTVKDSISSVDFTEFFLAENSYGVIDDSNVYYLQESFEGLFQIYFGGNVIGKQPTNGNIIEIDYIINQNLSSADGCRTFGFDGSIGVYTSINLATTQVSFGGSDKEKIDSIKYNAVKSNSAKERSVTASDYSLMIYEKFNFVKSVSVWGGEDNTPPVYGKVFVSLQPMSGYTISDDIKNNVITPVIRANSAMTIGIVYVDPTYINIYFTSRIKFNPTKSIFNSNQIADKVKEYLRIYVESLSSFNKDYLDSYASMGLMSLDSGIVSVNIGKSVGFKISPLIGVTTTHEKNVNNKIVLGSIKSTTFNIYSDSQVIAVNIREIPNSQSVVSGETRQALGLYNSVGLVSDIGYVVIDTGKFHMTFNTYSYISNTKFISVQFSLVNSDILTQRNTIINLDTTIEDSSIGLLSNNLVIVDIYDK